MNDDEFDSYPFLIFDEPKEIVRNGLFVGYQVPVWNPMVHQDCLGYVPLPDKYHSHWSTLCYQVVYFRNAFTTLRDTLQRAEGEVAGALTKSSASVAAILKYLLYARGMIIAEMFSVKGQKDPSLPTFDEFIIKNRFDYSWDSDTVLRTREHIFADPFSDDMKSAMRMLILPLPFSGS